MASLRQVVDDTNRTEDETTLVESFTPNPYLELMVSDNLYHLALGTATHNLPEMFGDVRFVCVGGTTKRMLSFAHQVLQHLDIKMPTGFCLDNITQDADRYAMFKVGPVLSVAHGMGISSISILLNELIKLIRYAQCEETTFLRIGTSGGLGLTPGTVVVSDAAVDGSLRTFYEMNILGKKIQCPASFDDELVQNLVEIGNSEYPEFKTVKGATMCTSDFYEGQGRVDGAFCSYTEQDKLDYLRKLNQHGVVNIEMECLPFGAMCQSAGIKGAVVCVTLLDRLKGDQIVLSPEDYKSFQVRPQLVAAEFIRQTLRRGRDDLK